MVIFLLDEATVIGKGANCVISFLDYFFDNYGVKETHVHLHADNCAGQNKNNVLGQYLLWRIVTGKHQRINLSFMVAGNTKFAPDSLFGLFKRKYRNSKVDCLADIENVVRQAFPSGVLIPQLCGDEMGNVIVPMYGWDSYLSPYFRKRPSIKPLHHIECRMDGTVMCKMTCLLKNPPLWFQKDLLTRGKCTSSKKFGNLWQKDTEIWYARAARFWIN